MGITGPRFKTIHEFLGERYHELLATMDDLAERVRTIGGTPISTWEEFSKEMSLDERSGKDMSTNEMLFDLFESNIAIQEKIKRSLDDDRLLTNDLVTEDFLINL